eukprot:GHUV01020751.1.p1 GENE.GHUV01020751.1~~GHUV01020751.1.p1  ORF type:complete len:196 (+),score=9.58 GHUV01020751.1:69-656(+)
MGVKGSSSSLAFPVRMHTQKRGTLSHNGTTAARPLAQDTNSRDCVPPGQEPPNTCHDADKISNSYLARINLLMQTNHRLSSWTTLACSRPSHALSLVSVSTVLSCNPSTQTTPARPDQYQKWLPDEYICIAWLPYCRFGLEPSSPTATTRPTSTTQPNQYTEISQALRNHTALLAGVVQLPTHTPQALLLHVVLY